MSSWSPTTYKTRNRPSYNSALKQRGSLSIRFDPEMPWHAPPTDKRGRQREFSDAAIQVCLTMKVLFGMPLRQTTGYVESLLRLAGLDWKVPDFSTLCRRRKTLNVAIPYRGGTGSLHLLIDATGIKAPSRQHPADAPAGQWRAKGSGTLAGMAGPGDAFGAGSTSVWTKKHWKSVQSGSQRATSAMRRCYPSCWTGSHPIKRSPLSPPMAHMIRVNAMMLSRRAEPTPSFRRAGMPNHGNRTRQALLRETRP